jgi:protein-disulfide isomerase-like protein with CxxC motif
MAAAVCITEFTDPGCPWAYSAEPVRARLRWLYGGHIDFDARMVVLSESPQDYLDKGFTPEKMAASFKRIAREYGMPIHVALAERLLARRRV